MWIKLLGGGMTIAATSWIGFETANRYRMRPLNLRYLQACLQMLETEINYGLTPLPRALEKIAATHQGIVGQLFGTVQYMLQNTPGTTVGKAWQEAVDLLWARLFFTEADYQMLLNFGTTLGASDRKDQIKHVKLIMAQIANAEAQAWEEKNKNERMFKTLGFLAGLTVVILLY